MLLGALGNPMAPGGSWDFLRTERANPRATLHAALVAGVSVERGRHSGTVSRAAVPELAPGERHLNGVVILAQGFAVNLLSRILCALWRSFQV